MRCLLIGNYGTANMGDEALKEYFLLSFPEIEWKVLSASPQKNELYRLPAGIRSFFSPWVRTLMWYKKMDAVVFGGGTLFTDIESLRACIIWFIHAYCAYLFRKPIILAFQGIGPFRTKIGKYLTRWVVQHASYLSVRDEESATRIDQFYSHTKYVRTFDPVILPMQKVQMNRSQKMIVLIPRQNSGTALLHAARQQLAAHSHERVKILLLQGDATAERQIAETLQQLAPDRTTIDGVVSFAELCEKMAGADCVVSERFHGALAALVLGIPLTIVSQAGFDKLAALRPYASGAKSMTDAFALAHEGEKTLRDALRMLSGPGGALH